MGTSPALFAWDIWNELHPAHAGDDPAMIGPFMADIAEFLRQREMELHGRAHLQTASIFGPELLSHPALREPIFRHAALDFATTHLYETGTIDGPSDTVAPALVPGRLMQAALRETHDLRPVLDTEQGPIHAFKDKHITLPDVSDEVVCSGDVAAFACRDDTQAVIWLLRTDTIGRSGTLAADASPLQRPIRMPGMSPGTYRITFFDLRTGCERTRCQVNADGSDLQFEACKIVTDIAVTIAKASDR